jgi:predicted RNA-binding Zn-ribbon protein involved in translation (DUF1610 family)
MAREQDLWVLPLVCPDCGGRLSAESCSVLFPCTACGTLWEPEGEVLRRQEIHVLSGGGSVQIPFWLFPFQITTRDGSAKTLADYRGLTGNINSLEPERQGPPPLVFVPAGTGMPPHLMVRAGRLLTLRSPELIRMKPFPQQLAAIGSRERDASLMAPTIVLATVTEERRRSLPFLQAFTVKVGRGKLCAIPFQERGERLLHAAWSLEI